MVRESMANLSKTHRLSAWVMVGAFVAGCSVPLNLDRRTPNQPDFTGRYGLQTLTVGIGLTDFKSDYESDYVKAFKRALILYKASSARNWDRDVAPLFWSNVAVDYIHDKIGNPPAQTRAHALVHLTVLRALLAVRGTFTGPHRCTLKEEAAIAAAVTTVLGTLFPSGATELVQIGDRRVFARVNNPKSMIEVTAGRTIGLQVGALMNDFAATDHGDPPATPYPQEEGRYYDPDPIGYDVPTWKPYVVDLSTGAYELPRVPQPGEPGFAEQVIGVIHARDHLTESKKRNAMFWASVLPPNDLVRILSLQLAERDFSSANAAQALAWNAVAQLDAFIACWTIKYDQKLVRPDVGIPGFIPWLATDDARRVFDDLGLSSIDTPYALFGTPRFPAYPSGHASQSAAAAAHAGWLLPDEKAFWESMAVASGVSRIDGGIHWPADHLGGKALGRAVATTVIARQQATRGVFDGWADQVPYLP